MDAQLEVVLGVDTHLNVDVGVVIDTVGRVLGTLSVPTNSEGYNQLLSWTRSFGCLRRAGVEGTGTYGSGLARLLTTNGIAVFEVNRPNLARRRLRGKSDPTDAENAARAVLAGEATALPKSQSGVVEALRVLAVTRRSAVKARTQAINQLRSLLVSAPDDVRARLLKTSPDECVAKCRRIRLLGNSPVFVALSQALRTLAKRWTSLSCEIKSLDRTLKQLTEHVAVRLLQQFGIGTQTAATLMVTAGDNPERLHSEAAFAALCGASPLQASSGKTVRHRLNRGGDRAANNALWTIAMVRMRSEERTSAYIARRTAEGMSHKEIQCCLKRYIAREIYLLLLADLHDASLPS